MNITNSNEDFQDFSKCDYNKHWSWSNLFRHIATCHAMRTLPDGARVLEIGAADSPLEAMMRDNFNRSVEFTKTDVNPKYEATHAIFDVSSDGLTMYPTDYFDAVILTEVIEHLPVESHDFVLAACSRVLSPDGIFILSTPTPKKPDEDRVWPEDHDFEYSLYELQEIIDKHFDIHQMMPWSMHKHHYAQLANLTGYLSFDEIFMPPEMNRALVGLRCPTFLARQILMICKKQRLSELEGEFLR